MKAIILPVCLLGVVTLASADDLRTQMTSMGEAVQKAMMKRDAAGFAAALKPVVTADFKYMDDPKAKPMNFDAMCAGMKGGMAMLASVTAAESKVLSVKTAGNTATAVVSHHMVGKTATSKQDPKSHTMAFNGVSIDTWVKSGASWKMSSMMWKSQETRLDGHLQKPMSGH